MDLEREFGLGLGGFADLEEIVKARLLAYHRVRLAPLYAGGQR